jgi:hypothetical protein
VITFDENKYENLEAVIDVSTRQLELIKDNLKELNRRLKRFQTASLKALNKEFGKDFLEQFDVERITDRHKEEYIQILRQNIAIWKLRRDAMNKDKEEALAEKKALNVGDLAEQRRLSDLKAKLDRKLADCDLLILPRMTIFNAARRERIQNQLHQLDKAQVDAIRDFLKRGKPVLACFGPPTDMDNMPQDFMHGRSDGLEEVLQQLGLRFERDTILYTSEIKSYGERRGPLVILGLQSEVPPAKFEWVPGGRMGRDALKGSRALDPNPIAESMRLTAAGVGPQENLDLRIRNPRPVTYSGLGGTTSNVDPVFFMTDVSAWKERQPFPSGATTPSPGKSGTSQQSIGVAIEASVPPSWGGSPGKVRVAGIGHGGVFMGEHLSPVREKLLLDTCNWLLGRDDLLAHANEQPWSFPRVALSDSSKGLWLWGTRLVIPLFFLLLGVAVLLKRSVR